MKINKIKQEDYQAIVASPKVINAIKNMSVVRDTEKYIRSTGSLNRFMGIEMITYDGMDDDTYLPFRSIKEALNFIEYAKKSKLEYIDHIFFAWQWEKLASSMTDSFLKTPIISSDHVKESSDICKQTSKVIAFNRGGA